MDDEPADPKTRAAEELFRSLLVPMVERDGGSAEAVDLTPPIVRIRLGRACAGCPGRNDTVRHALLPLLQAADERITGIELID